MVSAAVGCGASLSLPLLDGVLQSQFQIARGIKHVKGIWIRAIVADLGDLVVGLIALDGVQCFYCIFPSEHIRQCDLDLAQLGFGDNS